MSKRKPAERPEPGDTELSRLRRAQDDRRHLRPYVRCRECHCKIPESKPRNAFFCSATCRNRAKARRRSGLVSEIRVGLRQQDPTPCKAPDCDKAVPAEKRSSALYCSDRCKGRHFAQIHADEVREGDRAFARARRRRIAKKECVAPDCTDRLGPNRRANARYCSNRCAERVAQRRRYRPRGTTKSCSRCGEPGHNRRTCAQRGGRKTEKGSS